MWFAGFAPIATDARTGVKGAQGTAAGQIEAASSFDARARRTVRRAVVSAALPKVLTHTANASIAGARPAPYRIDRPSARVLQQRFDVAGPRLVYLHGQNESRHFALMPEPRIVFLFPADRTRAIARQKVAAHGAGFVGLKGQFHGFAWHARSHERIARLFRFLLRLKHSCDRRFQLRLLVCTDAEIVRNTRAACQVALRRLHLHALAAPSENGHAWN